MRIFLILSLMILFNLESSSYNRNQNSFSNNIPPIITKNHFAVKDSLNQEVRLKQLEKQIEKLSQKQLFLQKSLDLTNRKTALLEKKTEIINNKADLCGKNNGINSNSSKLSDEELKSLTKEIEAINKEIKNLNSNFFSANY